VSLHRLKRSGFPRGTIAPLVTRAIVAAGRSRIGGAGGTASYASTGISVWNGRPASLATSIDTARSAPDASRIPGRRTPRDR
jgi:hypothetical protein